MQQIKRQAAGQKPDGGVPANLVNELISEFSAFYFPSTKVKHASLLNIPFKGNCGNTCETQIQSVRPLSLI